MKTIGCEADNSPKADNYDTERLRALPAAKTSDIMKTIGCEADNSPKADNYDTERLRALPAAKASDIFNKLSICNCCHALHRKDG